MKLDLYMQKTSNIFAENRLLKFVIIVLASVVIASFYYVNHKISNQKIILVPPNIHSKIMIIGNKPDTAYIKQFTRYIVSLAFDYTSISARSQFEELLSLYSPEEYNNAKKMFYGLASDLESIGNVSNLFSIYGIKVTKNKIEVTGLEKTYVGDKLQTSKQRTYDIEYIFKNDKFFIRDIKKEKK